MRSQNYIVYHGIQILNLNLAFLGVRGKTSFKKKKEERHKTPEEKKTT